MTETRRLVIERDVRPDLDLEIPVGVRVSIDKYDEGDTALRVSDTDGSVIVYIEGVYSVRDLSIPVKRRTMRTGKSSRETRDNKGNSVFAEQISVDDGGWEDLND